MRNKYEVTRNRQRDRDQGVGDVVDTAVASDLTAELKRDSLSEFHESAGGSDKKSVCSAIITDRDKT